MAMPPIEAPVSAHCLGPLPNLNVTNSRPSRQGRNAPARVVRHFGPGQESDHRHRRLLRAHPNRPRRRAAEQRDELAPLHSITSSAMACNVGGTVRPSALAVLRLMTSSSLVDCWTGKSAGLAPWRILPT